MRVLTLDAALTRSCVGVVVDGAVVAARSAEGGRGQAAWLPVAAQHVLAQAGLTALELDWVAATVGPGSFTGIRAALALAGGIAMAAGIPVVGVTVGEALASALPHLGSRTLWSAVDSRSGRVFLETNTGATGCVLGALPQPEGPVAVAGDAAPTVAAAWAAQGADVMLTDARRPALRHVALAAAARRRGDLPPRAAQPLYVEEPKVTRASQAASLA